MVCTRYIKTHLYFPAAANKHPQLWITLPYVASQDFFSQLLIFIRSPSKFLLPQHVDCRSFFSAIQHLLSLPVVTFSVEV